MDNLLSSEEVRRYLELRDGDLDRLIQTGRLHAYKIGGAFLRFRKDEILTLKQEFQSGKKIKLSVPWFARVLDFWRFNNFYILSLLLIAALFYFLLRP